MSSKPLFWSVMAFKLLVEVECRSVVEWRGRLVECRSVVEWRGRLVECRSVVEWRGGLVFTVLSRGGLSSSLWLQFRSVGLKNNNQLQ